MRCPQFDQPLKLTFIVRIDACEPQAEAYMVQMIKDSPFQSQPALSGQPEPDVYFRAVRGPNFCLDEASDYAQACDRAAPRGIRRDAKDTGYGSLDALIISCGTCHWKDVWRMSVLLSTSPLFYQVINLVAACYLACHFRKTQMLVI